MVDQVLLPALFVDTDTFIPNGDIAGDGPFWFARVSSSETTFDSTHLREDYVIIKFRLRGQEGNKPSLEIDIENPGVQGLLATGQPLYCWFSWYNKDLGTPESLFFGRLVGLPSNVIARVVTLVYVADPEDYIQQLVDLTRPMKKRPNYDPLCLDDSHRDDPDSILEGYAAHFCVNRIAEGAPNEVTVSELISGYSGTTTFEQEEIRDGSLQLDMSQVPKTHVKVNARYGWTQRASGSFDMGDRSIQSYGGDAIIQSWPKPLTDLQGGYYALEAYALDALNIENQSTSQYEFRYQNNEDEHNNGDTMSLNVSATIPSIDNGINYTLKVRSKTGVLDPFHTDENGDDDPINIPPHSEVNYIVCPLWVVKTHLILGYNAERERTEHFSFVLTADLQPITSTIDVPTNTEIIELSVADVDQSLASGGSPNLVVLNYESVAGGEAVEVGQVVKVPTSDDPLILKENWQIAIEPGNTGGSMPDFSVTIPGTLVTDGTVTWAALGETPMTDYPEWPISTVVAEGFVIRPKPIGFFTTWDVFVGPNPIESPEVEEGQVIRGTDGNFWRAQVGGTGTIDEPPFAGSYGDTVTAGVSEWVNLGTLLANNTAYYLCVEGGETGDLEPNWGSATDVGDLLVDGDVTWVFLGTAGAFIGVPIGDVSLRAFLPTDRGNWLLEYAICVARAHILAASRCASTSFKTYPEKITNVSCDHNALVLSSDLPRGYVWGKITEYIMEGDGESGSVDLQVTVSSAIGKGVSVTEDAGTGDYVEDDMFEDGVQEVVGQILGIPSGDVGYTVPQDNTIDDGIVFPVTKSDVVIEEGVSGSLGAQAAGILSAFQARKEAMEAEEESPNGIVLASPTGHEIGTTVKPAVIKNRQTQAATDRADVGKRLAENPIYYHAELKPLTGQSFESIYLIETTPQTVIRGIDLEYNEA